MQSKWNLPPVYTSLKPGGCNPQSQSTEPMPSLDNLTIRLARPEDVLTIASFSAAMALETEGRHLDLERLHKGTIALLESTDRGFYMVAEIEQTGDRQLLGQLMITYEWSDWRNGTFWWIQSVYVAPQWRRRGVYSSMHKYIMALAQADPQVCGIRLYVEQENRTAQTVYSRVGLSLSRYKVFEEDLVLTKPSER
jgi:ribosomal protein S18 acetylase RimI-like enzyme